jgi:hypothetical protein
MLKMDYMTTQNNLAALGLTEVVQEAAESVPDSRTVNGYPLSSDVELTASDVGAVPTSLTVNGHALTGNIALTASDVGAIPTGLASGEILVGNGSNVAAAVGMSGDAGIDNTGKLTIGSAAITYSKIQNVAATSRVLGRISTGTGSIEELTAANVKTILGLTAGDVGAISTTLASGEILVGNGSNVAAAVAMTGDAGIDDTGKLTIGSAVVSYSKIQNVAANNVVLGNVAGAGNTVQELTATNIKSILSLAQADISGLTTGSSPTFSGLSLTQNLTVPSTVYGALYGIIYKGNSPFIHDFNYGNNGTVTTAGQNIFIGLNAGNFTMGSGANSSNQASGNVGIGNLALSAITIGYYNVAVGPSAAQGITTGANNLGLGYCALQGVTTGGNNVGVGYCAMRYVTTSGDNIAIGNNAGRFISGGSTHNITGSQSIFIGSSTYPLADADANEVVIGYGAVGAGSNTVTLGNTSVVTTLLNGKVGIGVATQINEILTLKNATWLGAVNAAGNGSQKIIGLNANNLIAFGSARTAASVPANFVPNFIMHAQDVNGADIYWPAMNAAW